MKEVSVHDVKVDFCTECEGSWFDFGELSHMFSLTTVQLKGSDIAATRDSGGPEREVDLEEPVLCPRCGETTDRGPHFSDCPVIVDRCEEHGVWLDDGELGALLDHMAKKVKGSDPTESLLFRVASSVAGLFKKKS
jgi:Zn-finger nucleic acid-binding protein